MSLQTRLAELITAIGADIKGLQGRGGIIWGVGAPNASHGITGDYYVNILNGQWYGPRGINLGDNLVGNPSFDDEVAGANPPWWTSRTASNAGLIAMTCVIDDTLPGIGHLKGMRYKIQRNDNAAIRLSNASGVSGMPVDPTQAYYVYMAENVIDPPGTSYSMRIYWYKADGSASSIITSSPIQTQTTTGEKTHLVNGIQPPSDAAFASLAFYGSTNGSPDTIDVLVYEALFANVWKAIPVSPGSIASGTSLPSSPADGQEYYYVADAANGVVWHLRYNSTAGKWLHEGGASLYAEDLANRASSNNTPNYTAMATAVQVTAPLAGTYEVEYSVTASTTGTNTGLFTDVAVGATVGADQNGSVFYMNTGTIVQGSTHKKRKITCAAGDVVALVHKASVTTITARARTLSLTPIAVS